MKKIFVLSMLLCFAATLAFAQQTTPSAASEEMSLQGTVVDNLCASGQKPEALAEFLKTHTKECALMPQCVASGYSIFANGQLMKFDAASNAKIEEFLKKPDSTTQVKAAAKKAGDALSLISIENQK